MSKSNTNTFSPAILRKAKFARSLGHPVRIAIIEYLLSHEKCSSGTLTHEISLSQSTLAQHLKLLKNAGLLNYQTMGKETFFFINREVWSQVEIRSLLRGG